MTRPAALLGILGLAGCAYVGDPKPPALNIPTPITDLRGAEYGAQIIVEFTVGSETTEGLDLTKVTGAELHVSAGTTQQTLPVPVGGPGPVRYQFPARDWIGRPVTITVRASGPKGKASDWSNPVVLTVGVPIPTPERVQAVSVPQGVLLKWEDSFANSNEKGARYRIFRGLGEAMPERMAESDKPEYTDTAVEMGSAYRYFVQALVGELRQSVVSKTVGITAMDTFPPSVPTGLSAVAGVNSIELVWNRNMEDDFAGYQVYRSTGGGPPERIAGPIEAPTFSDRTVELGKRYGYTVTATDRAGNESGPSPAAEATAQ